jgi:glycosyltransferase involved in cell wall biosynthesis
MHVLLLCEYATLNGGERSMLATLDAVRAEFTITALAPGAGPLAEEFQRREMELLPLPTGTQSARREALARLLSSRRFDLLHANSLTMGRLAGPVAAAARTPSLAHLRDIIGLSGQATADLNCHTRLLAVSHATRNWHVAAGLSAEKTHVLYNGIDLQQWQPRPPSGYLHRELGIPPTARLVATIGQIGLRKGQDLLVQAAVDLAEQFPEVHYLVVGERCSQKAESRQFEAKILAAAAGPLAGRLHLLGVRNDVDRLLHELTLLVHPARQEPLGRVLLEAAASGVCAIATRVGGTVEIFPSETAAARLIPPNDPPALAAAMAELLADEAAQMRLGQSARARAEQCFDLRRAAAGLIGHYRQIV